jgi:molybdate transport system substrate-binding protein
MSEPGKVVVFAAGSLVDAFSAIGSDLEWLTPGTTLSYRFASADHLRRDIVAGAPCDVFAPANRLEMDLLRDAGFLVDEPREFARNSLVIIVQRDNPSRIAGIGDLARPDLRLVAEHPEAPLSRYTAQMLESVGEDGAFGKDFVTRVEARVTTRTNNVRQVVARVLAGAADAAVVYASDVTPDVKERLSVIEIPPRFNVTASYFIATVMSGSNAFGGARFVEYVLSRPGQATLAQWGFRPVAIAQSPAPPG